MEHLEGTRQGVAGVPLYWQAWLPTDEVKATIVVSHGLGEHSGRYANLVDGVVPQGYAVYAIDHRSHGRSGGPPGRVDDFRAIVADFTGFVDFAREKQGGKTFVLGHSMGGMIALRWAIEHQDHADGLIISSQGVMTDDAESAKLRRLGRIGTLMAKVAPNLPLTALDPAGVSRQDEVVQAYKDDPLVFHGKLTARSGAQLLAEADSLAKDVGRITLPLLIINPTADQMAPPSWRPELLARVSSEDKTLEDYEGFYHEAFNEAEHKQVIDDLIAWLSARL